MAEKLLNYDVLELVGEGARSTIYLVQDPLTRQLYALKHVKRLEQKDLRFIEQMENEFAISRQFNHPNLRRSLDLKVQKTMLVKVSEAYMVMEWVDGKPLDVLVPTNLVEICDIFIKAAEGLKSMHQMGYAHCDIKPNNILHNGRGMVKVIDFGQSCKIGTIKERIQGTPDFIAPEQVARRPIVVQTDVFNLGATLYWVLTGKHIPTLYTTSKKGENSFLLDTAIDAPVDLNPKIPLPLSNLALECVSTRPAKRPTDMDAVIQRLELAKHVLTRPTDTGPISPDDSVAGLEQR